MHTLTHTNTNHTIIHTHWQFKGGYWHIFVGERKSENPHEHTDNMRNMREYINIMLKNKRKYSFWLGKVKKMFYSTLKALLRILYF